MAIALFITIDCFHSLMFRGFTYFYFDMRELDATESVRSPALLEAERDSELFSYGGGLNNSGSPRRAGESDPDSFGSTVFLPRYSSLTVAMRLVSVFVSFQI